MYLQFNIKRLPALPARQDWSHDPEAESQNALRKLNRKIQAVDVAIAESA